MITGRMSSSVVECGGPLWFSLARIAVAARYTVLYAVQGFLAAPWHSGFRRRYVPNALNKRSVQEESRGRRGPSQQGQHSAARCGEGSIDLRRLEMHLQRSIGTSCLWSTCDAG